MQRVYENAKTLISAISMKSRGTSTSMAILLRRAFSCRNVVLHRSSAVYGRELSYLIGSANGVFDSQKPIIHSLQVHDFLREIRRGFAKGRKSKDDSGSSSSVAELPEMGLIIKSNAISQMESAITSLSIELSKLRTGRASSGMLDHIIVDLGDMKLPLNQIAVVSVMDTKTLSINPFDPTALKHLEKAINASPLGLNPKEEGERLIAVIPPLTKEHIQAVCKVVTKSCEDARLSIRRARQKAMDSIKKMQSSYPKDELKRLEKEVEELTKKFVKSAEDLCKTKEKEISS